MVVPALLGKETTLNVTERGPEAKATPQELTAGTTANVIEPPAARAGGESAPPRYFRRIEPFWWIGSVVVGSGGWWLLIQAWG